ncbi:hypothetical protein ACFQU7_07805 [Pseudoroseomonas wenyumeiae]
MPGGVVHDPAAPHPAPPGAIYHAAPIDAAGLRQAAGRAAAMGFDALCHAHGGHGGSGPGARPAPAAGCAHGGIGNPADPTSPPDPRFRYLRRPAAAQDAAGWLAHWREWLAGQARGGIAGFRCLLPDWVEDGALRDLTAAAKAAAPEVLLIACLEHPRTGLREAGFDLLAPALPWVDVLEAGTALWAEELPLLPMAEAPGARRLANRWGNRMLAARALRRAIRLAAFSGPGWLMPAGMEGGALHRGSLPPAEDAAPRIDLLEAVKAANAARAELPAISTGPLTSLLSAPMRRWRCCGRRRAGRAAPWCSPTPRSSNPASSPLVRCWACCPGPAPWRRICSTPRAPAPGPRGGSHRANP